MGFGLGRTVAELKMSVVRIDGEEQLEIQPEYKFKRICVLPINRFIRRERNRIFVLYKNTFGSRVEGKLKRGNGRKIGRDIQLVAHDY